MIINCKDKEMLIDGINNNGVISFRSFKDVLLFMENVGLNKIFLINTEFPIYSVNFRDNVWLSIEDVKRIIKEC